MRTLQRFLRVYMNGYDVSGYSRSIGPLVWTFSEDDQTCIPDAVQGALPGKATLGIGTLNAVLDNTATSSIHALASSAGVARKMMIPIGMSAAPVSGNPVYCGEFNQNGYLSDVSNDSIAVNAPFGMNTPTTGMLYKKPWGVLLHAKGSETAVNTGSGIDNAAASSVGGYLMYQIFSITGTGTVTLTVQESSDDGDTDAYAGITGATSGAIATASAPTAGIVQLGVTTAIERYIRWQIAFGGSASACEFALAFIRG